MAAAYQWTHDQLADVFRKEPELKPLLLTDVEDTGIELGRGSYGVVRKLRAAGGTYYAGKTLHDVFIQPQDKGTKVVIDFFMECKLLADLRHPNILQLMGVCLLKGSKMPTLLTEILTDSLHNFLTKREEVKIEVRQSFMGNVASALVFLHSRKPPIIHRDLTGRNVLVDERGMKAKIADLGNSRFMPRPDETMTRAPGNPDYMSPEAMQQNPKYCEKLDIFSFGHLCLFTLTKVYPKELLPPTSPIPNSDKLISRTEVERRGKSMDLLKKELGEDHSLVHLVRMCLHNDPNKRPTAMEAQQNFQELEDAGVYEDIIPFRQRTVEILNQKEQEIARLKHQLSQAQIEMDVISGPLEKVSGIMKRWRLYAFKATETRLVYYTLDNKPRHEILLSDVSCVLIPNRPGKGGDGKFCFEIHFRGKDSPWTLSAYSQEERKEWMRAIRRQKPMPTEEKPSPEYDVLSPKKEQSEGKKGEKDQELKVKQNVAYEWQPQAKRFQDLPDIPTEIDSPTTPGEHLYESIPSLPSNLSPPEPPPATTSELSKPTLQSHSLPPPPPAKVIPKLALSPPALPPNTNKPSKAALAPPPPISIAPTTKEPRRPTKPPPLPLPSYFKDDQHSKQPTHLSNRVKIATDKIEKRKSKKPMEKTVGVDKPSTPSYEGTYATLFRRANKFNKTQIRHLIDMLQQTEETADSAPKGRVHVEQVDGKPSGITSTKREENEPSPDSTYVPPYYVNYDALLDRSTLPRSGSKSHHYVNYLDVCERGRPHSVKKHGEEPRPHSASPKRHDQTFFNFSDLSSDDYFKLSQSNSDLSEDEAHRGGWNGGYKQSQFLKPPRGVSPSHELEEQEVLRRVLAKQSEQARESLLITEDDSYVTRPKWARANVNRPTTTKGSQPRAIYIQPRTLTNGKMFAEGKFGMVYKAEMLRRDGRTTTVAIKKVDSFMPDFVQDISSILGIAHPNIVRIHGLLNEGKMKPALVMEYLMNRDLKSFLVKNNRDTPQLMNYMVDVAMGMHFLSSKGIIHGDLAAHNVLVDKDELCKVADFGLIRVPREAKLLHASQSRAPSPIRWMAPETFSKGFFSTASDIWSYGILQWEMFNPRAVYPYPTLRNDEVEKKVTAGFPVTNPRNTSPIVVKIMKACLNREPSLRPSFLLISNLLTSNMMDD